MDEAIERHLSKAYWPWSVALAYCQPVEKRQAALAAVTEVIDTYGEHGSGALAYAGAASLHVLYEALHGRASQIDWASFEDDERRLLGAVQAGSIRVVGRASQDGPIIEIPVTDWIGGEVDGDATCDLVTSGWRSKGLLDQALTTKRAARFYDLHIHGDIVRQHAQALDGPPAAGNWAEATLAPYLATASAPREGFWTAWPTLAWIASRDDRFIAATQSFEHEAYANRGGPHSAAAWMTLGDSAGERYGCTFSDAEGSLREALETGRLTGGIAVDAQEGSTVPIERWQWTRWNRTFVTNGLSLLPGYVDFRWPSELVRSAFPRIEPVSSPPSGEENEKPVVTSTGAAMRECTAWLRGMFQDASTASWAKPSFRKAALERFSGRLSGRGFDKVWLDLTKEFPERAQAGAKRKSAQAIQFANN